jgi:mycobactin peptide synthetase MbtE
MRLLLHELVHAQAERTPLAAAVDFGDQSLTYAELERLSTRVAEELANFGAGPEAIVGLHFERSPEVVVAMLGSLKAGGAYLPLPVEYPSARLRFMVRDAKPVVVATSAHALAHSSMDAPTLVIDDVSPTHPAPRELPGRVLPGNAAYIIYTSGSTGPPKGVVVPHEAICNHLLWLRSALPIGPGDRVLQAAPFGVDAAVTDFFWPLTSGASVVVLSARDYRDPRQIMRSILGSRVTALRISPSLLPYLLDEVERQGVPPLRYLVVGGERLSVDLRDRCLELLPDARIYNRYGPTEATVAATYGDCRKGDHKTVAIGRPIDGAEVYLSPVASEPLTGTAGEVLIGGVALARCYLNRPALTAERFVPNLAGAPGSRLFRTGDIGRRTEDGQLEFLRREDRQVKIRGIRVEIGEIEWYLARHPGVAACAVALQRTPRGDERLVAYVVPTAGGRLSPRTLRGVAMTELPDHMVPSAFVLVGALPLSPAAKVEYDTLTRPGWPIEAVLNGHPDVKAAIARDSSNGSGKRLVAYVSPRAGTSLDRDTVMAFLQQALPSYLNPADVVMRFEGSAPNHPRADEASHDAESATVLPDGVVAAEVRRVWADVLETDHVSGNANFFDLGGTSLHAIRFASRIRSTLGRDLSVADVFEQPRLEDLVAALANQANDVVKATDGAATTPPGSANSFPLMPTQERIWFLHRLDPESVAYNFQAIFRFEGVLDEEALRKALDEIVVRHEILRTTFPAREGRPQAIAHAPEPAALSVVDIESMDGDEVEALAGRFAADFVRRPFDVTRRPLIRWLLLRLSPQRAWLVHSQHHLVHDGWSFPVLVSELVRLYRFHRGADTSPLDQLPLQFGDEVRTYRARLDAIERDQVEYWRQELAGVPDLELPVDPDRPPATDFSGRLLRVPVPTHLVQLLKRESMTLGATPFMTSFAAFAAWLSACTNQEDFALGTSVANRRSEASEQLIGCFLNNIAIRVRPRMNRTFRQLADDIRDSLLRAYKNQDAPFHLVVQALGRAGGLSVNPVFQLTFNFHDSPFPALDFPDLRVALEEGTDNGAAKFGLHVVVVRRMEKRVFPVQNAEEEMELHWHVNTSIFDETEARLQSQQFLAVLEAALRNPDLPLESLTAAVKAGEAGFDRTPPRPGRERVRADQGALTTSRLEEPIAAVWQEVLALDEVERDADFFELGGHSLLAVQVVVRLGERLGLELPVSALFEAPTVRELAAMAETLTAGSE